MTEHTVVAFGADLEPVYPRGPFDKEPRVCIGRDLHRDLRRRLLLQALDGIEQGAWDHEILDWLSMWEPSTLVTIAGWIWRARMASTDSPAVTEPGPHGDA